MNHTGPTRNSAIATKPKRIIFISCFLFFCERVDTQRSLLKSVELRLRMT